MPDMIRSFARATGFCCRCTSVLNMDEVTYYKLYGISCWLCIMACFCLAAFECVQAPPAKQLSALALVLAHPVLAQDPLLLCSAAQVCSSWRAAVEASGAATTVLNMQSITVVGTLDGRPARLPIGYRRFPASPRSQCDLKAPDWIAWAAEMQGLIQRLQGFPAWLRKHAHLISSMALSGEYGDVVGSVLQNTICHDTIVLQLPHLQSFTASSPPANFLKVLPEGLTHLALSSVWRAPAGDLQPLHGALQRCKHLQFLSLGVDSPSFDFGLGAPHDVLDWSPLAQLVQLTQLHLNAQCTDDEWATLEMALPKLTALRVLGVKCAAGSFRGRPRVLHLAGMVGLHELRLQLAPTMLVADSHLPSQLTTLVLDCSHIGERQERSPVTAFGLKDLGSLQDLTVVLGTRVLADMPGTSAALQQLTQLNRLELQYEHLGSVHLDRLTWRQLPALVKLTMFQDSLTSYWPYQEISDVFAGIARATALTALHVRVPGDEDEGPVSFCLHLAGLTSLQELCLEYCDGTVAVRDCMHLSVLTALTQLKLEGFGAAVDDTVAVALALNMPKLRCLKMIACGLQSDAVMPVLLQRTQLRRVRLYGNPGVSDSVLTDWGMSD